MILGLIMRVIAGIALMLLITVFAVLFEGVDRKLHAVMQRRIGPPLLQPVYDILKLLGKENIVPRWATPVFFHGGPWVAMIASMMVFMYIPMGSLPPVLNGSGDLILILYLLSLSGVAVAVGGFASGSPIANVGAQREMILMMSYEVPLAIVVSTLAWFAYKLGMPGHPFSLETYVATSVWSVVGKAGFLGLICLFVAILTVIPGETGKGLMDIPEAKTEILEGVTVEYSGVNLALLHIGFNLRGAAISALVVSLFFPFSLGKAIGLSGVPMAIIDFPWFWVKVFLVEVFGVTFLRTAFGRLKIWQASHFYWAQVGALSLAGMILISVDVLLH
ncbi:respiratory-chain NADH dehydrogenase subunit 1 [Dethiosulfovibrio peptidovorans DSM 11002]|uniref:Respiratory-chain NADH dehydrogenase subunit 1 n=1 Tax=Dethiosulfovibrio peptidovorans DSM 11002 TaxID=469381 RepID=D2Z4V4_9BACT|nr:complex I subunit 1 family protein [Dethiosulfovibrio peptidovorans]EFC92448.1 respiratory-chain NADH dehydrogenase subunit 1 [Dethiosulfovibrio peptidovorans DSM 11002]